MKLHIISKINMDLGCKKCTGDTFTFHYKLPQILSSNFPKYFSVFSEQWNAKPSLHFNIAYNQMIAEAQDPLVTFLCEDVSHIAPDNRQIFPYGISWVTFIICVVSLAEAQSIKMENNKHNKTHKSLTVPAWLKSQMSERLLKVLFHPCGCLPSGQRNIYYIFLLN